MVAKKPTTAKKITLKDFEIETLGENQFDSPLELPNYDDHNQYRVLYQNRVGLDGKFDTKNTLSFERPGPFDKIYFDSKIINVGIVTCGGLCPGLNDVIRTITYNCLEAYGVKTVYGFRHGYEGLTSKHSDEVVILTPDKIDNIHEQGGTILSSSRGDQSKPDMVDTLVKYNISILFLIGGDGTQRGTLQMQEVINKRKLKISVIGIPKTIDNDISFIYTTFGFDTAVEQARRAIDAAHVESKGTRNGIGMVKLMGRHSGFIAAHATLASGNVNICLIPEEPIVLKELYAKIKKRFSKNGNSHIVLVVAEGAGQNLLESKEEKVRDASGNVKLKDIGVFLKEKIGQYLKKENIPHSIKYIDPSYMIRSTPANAIDSSFCLRLGNYAVHAAMAGKTGALIGFWNQHFCLVPIKLALSKRKQVDTSGSMWRAVKEITLH